MAHILGKLFNPSCPESGIVQIGLFVIGQKRLHGLGLLADKIGFLPKVPAT